MRRLRNAKIIATLGPASESKERLTELFKVGADVFRLNFSHGSHEGHKARFDTIRCIEKSFGRPIGILQDLQGPKLRVGKFEGGKARVESGQLFRLDMARDPGDTRRVQLPHPEVFKALSPQTELLLDDGRVRLCILDCGDDWAETEVVVGGLLSDHKGVNVPSAVLDLSPLTPKDRRDLEFGLQMGVDWVGLSFVQRAEDVAEARRLVDGRAAILVKIEKPAAIDQLAEIVELADAVMVARGDLGVEVPAEDVPVLQKEIIHACQQKGRPVVVATQMLDSMVHAPMPTRAEASDVATAIYDGADAVMLSAETAVGDYPIEAVRMMDRIIRRIERDPLYRKVTDAERRMPESTAADAITAAARQVAHTISAACIVAFSSTGSTTLRAARERPEVPILGLTANQTTARRLALAWGVHPVLTSDLRFFNDMVMKAVSVAVKEEFAVAGQQLVVTAGVPFGTPGATNVLRIAKV
ncbi:MAG: pyruvate kinase [Magnetospirillum sp. WYHS-4]